MWKTMDACIPGLVLAHLFGRLGCLSAGCCYGKPTDKPWGIRLYSDLVDEHLRGIPLHPTQLYEAGALGILFLGLLWIFHHRKFDGQVALTYFLAYPIIRSIVEIFRGDLIRGFVIDGVAVHQPVHLGAGFLCRRGDRILDEASRSAWTFGRAGMSALSLDGGAWMVTAAILVQAFIIGSVPFGILVARAFNVRDLTRHGSGNMGATNVSRVIGFWPAGLITFLLDVGKGSLPTFCWLIAPVSARGASRRKRGRRRRERDASLDDRALRRARPLLLALDAFPWAEKGVATGFGAFLVLSPISAACGILAFAFTFFSTRLGSLSSLVGLAITAAAYLVLNPIGAQCWAGAAMVMLILVRHQANIEALLEGRESRFDKR